MIAPRAGLIIGSFLGSSLLCAQAGLAPGGDDKVLKDLLELMQTPVVSASRTAERLIEAPATVIVLSRADLEDRGYTELSQILDDLPGMDVVRSYGANFFKDYWRGYRNDVGDPFLVMVDGVTFNHLWYNTADTPLVGYPLSAIEQVEVVYGPASAVYGTNAFMGVINIITRKADGRNGFTLRGKLTTGSFSTRIADIHALHRAGDLVFSLAARSDKGNVDEEAAERYEYTKARYYRDRRLWGHVLDDPSLGGSARSEHQHSALDARLTWGSTEFGIRRFVTSSGYGTAYAADESQSNARWVRPELSIHLRQELAFGNRVTSVLLARYRRSDLSNASRDVTSYYGYGSGTQSVLSRYEALNSSLSLSQDFEVKASDQLAISAGLNIEQKNLQKAYAVAEGGAKPLGSLQDTNHFSSTDRGLYAQGRFSFGASSRVFAGLRSDHNSIYGTANTLRGGYVGTFGHWSFKALHGQAYQEPTARLLYGATLGTGSNENLRPETSSTSEISASLTRRTFNLSLAYYRVKNHGRIQKLDNQVVNSGDQEVDGLDVGFQALVPFPGAQQLKVWGYYSRYLHATDISFQPGTPMESRSGDLAGSKVWIGATLNLNSHFNASFLGRIIGPRPTVLSNPVREVPGYATFDLALNGRDLWKRGLGLSLRIANLGGKEYFHPGLRDAGAGTRPGGFDAAGQWTGSGSYYNSLLPQPGCSVQASLNFTF